MKAALVTLTIFLCWYGATAMEVWLYSHGSNAKFTIDKVQRCYTVEDLWNDRAVRATWKKLPKNSKLVFYKHATCVKPKVEMEESRSGSFSFEKEKKLNLAVSSFLVQRDSEYPTAGKVEIEADYPDPIEWTKVNNGTSGGHE